MKKLFLIPLIVLFTVSLVLGSCAEPAPAPAPTPAPPPTPTPAPAETIELKMSHAFPPPSGLGVALENWAQSINDQTNGRVKITVYGGGALVKSAEWFDAAITGVTDIAYGHPSEDLSRCALETGFGLPNIKWHEKWPDVDTRVEIQEQIRGEFAEIAQAQKGVYRLFDAYMPTYVFQTASTEVRVPDDVKGMKVAATGFYASVADILEAIPVVVSAPDRYMALERGTIEGSWDIWGGIKAMKHYEVSDYYLEGAPFGASMAEIVMNEAKLNSLPPDIQQIFRNQRSVSNTFHYTCFLKELEPGREAAKGDNGVFIIPTAAEMELWNKALEPSHSEWVKQISDLGFPAQKFLDRLLELIDERM